MATATALEQTDPTDRVFTTADLLALPDDGVERWLIDGRIVEAGMTIRNRRHTRVEARVAQQLLNWVDAQPEPRGAVHSGEVGVRLQRDPDRTVGVDLVYLAPDISARVEADDTTTIIDGVPTLAVEILSPSDTVEEIEQKIDIFLDAGVPVVWVMNPHRRTVTVYRRGQAEVMHPATADLDGGDVLPGFRVPVARLFPG